MAQKSVVRKANWLASLLSMLLTKLKAQRLASIEFPYKTVSSSFPTKYSAFLINDSKFHI
jgi:hypothetical protein